MPAHYCPDVRMRRPEDVPGCVRLLAEVHEADAYPLHWPAEPERWLTPADLITAWVGEEAGELLGHVALCTAVRESAAPWWEGASGISAARMGVVAKLFTAPWARGRGVGVALMETAMTEARRRDLLPVLEVLDLNRSAIALYEAMGWRRVGSAPASWAQGSVEHPVLHYYILGTDVSNKQ